MIQPAIKVAEAAKEAGVSRDTIKRWGRVHRLFRLIDVPGHHPMVDAHSFRSFLRQHTRESAIR